MDKKAKKMFPELKPIVPMTDLNVKRPDGDEKPKEKRSQKDMFQSDKKENIKLEVNNEVVEVKKDRYAHLAKAREKALEKRRAKMKIKNEQKARDKEEKLRLRAEKKKARDEKNRIKSRERYWAMKREKEAKNNEEKIEEPRDNAEQIVAPPPPQKVAPQKKVSFSTNTPLSYAQFSPYMDRYTQSRIPKKTKPIPVPKVNHQQNELEQLRRARDNYHPANYPLSHMNPYNRKYKQFGI